MPELPEVETTVNYLKNRAPILGARFINAWSDWIKIVKKPKNFKQFKKDIKNKKIKNIWRRAKNIIFDLSEGYSLLIHQKMTGHLLYGSWDLVSGSWKPTAAGPLNNPYNRFLHLIFFFDNSGMMALSDARKFAKAELWRTEELLNSKGFKRLGPEPLEESFTFEKFRKIFENKKGRIKQILMDQSFIAGIGNIYSSEILWWAKVHPEKNVKDLSNKELELLYKSIKKVLELGIKCGGESFSDYRKPDGSKGGFDAERRVYWREDEPCKRCGNKIKRIKLGQRSAFFCSKCQVK